MQKRGFAALTFSMTYVILSLALRIAELEQNNAHLSGQNAQLVARLETLQRQLDWFKRQLFGHKSEQLRFIDPAVQGNLLEALGVLKSVSRLSLAASLNRYFFCWGHTFI